MSYVLRPTRFNVHKWRLLHLSPMSSFLRWFSFCVSPFLSRADHRYEASVIMNFCGRSISFIKTTFASHIESFLIAWVCNLYFCFRSSIKKNMPCFEYLTLFHRCFSRRRIYPILYSLRISSSNHIPNARRRFGNKHHSRVHRSPSFSYRLLSNKILKNIKILIQIKKQKSIA